MKRRRTKDGGEGEEGEKGRKEGREEEEENRGEEAVGKGGGCQTVNIHKVSEGTEG